MNSSIPTSSVDLSHHVQRQILMLLRQNGPLTYQQLKQDGLEGNAYNYHLRLLKNAGLITHAESLYNLTATGYLVADAFSFDKKRLMLRPHMYVTLFVTAGENMLLYFATRQPLAGKVGLPSGKLHFGQSFPEGIKQELARRDLNDTFELKQAYPMNACYTLGGQPVYHRPGIAWHIEYHGSQNERTTDSGHTKWLPITEVTNLQNSLPEVTKLLAHIQNQTAGPIDFIHSLDEVKSFT